MAPLRPNQDVILDKSFWTQPFLLGVFCWFFLLDFFTIFFTIQQYFDYIYI
jgi:hypothetical protein